MPRTPDWDRYLDFLIEESQSCDVDEDDIGYTKDDWEEDMYDEFEFVSD